MPLPATNQGRRTDQKLPQGIVEMPAEVTEEEWKRWPRKNEAHLLWGLRERQITALCTAKRLIQYRADDASIRLDPDQLRAEFGEPDDAKGRMGKAGKPGGKANGLDIDIDDPYPGLLLQLSGVIKDMREDFRKVLELALEPANKHVENLLADNDRKTQRITELENRWAMDQERRSTELEQMRAYEIESQRIANQERRRTQIMAMLNQQVPSIVAKFTGGPSVTEFLADLDPEKIEMLLVTDFLPEDKKAQLRVAMAAMNAVKDAAARATGKQAPAAPATEQPGASSAPMNGAASA
jgi:G:T/U-mismatch repair DNA glycosylase